MVMLTFFICFSTLGLQILLKVQISSCFLLGEGKFLCEVQLLKEVDWCGYSQLGRVLVIEVMRVGEENQSYCDYWCHSLIALYTILCCQRTLEWDMHNSLLYDAASFRLFFTQTHFFVFLEKTDYFSFGFVPSFGFVARLASVSLQLDLTNYTSFFCFTLLSNFYKISLKSCFLSLPSSFS